MPLLHALAQNLVTHARIVNIAKTVRKMAGVAGYVNSLQGAIGYSTNLSGTLP
ncbi:hypothetical protein WG906_17340 [Pedobacter sp. P351]|uniref:hypothetical protein n=1 Tax=Pedobacter superstes TaxID=3133441 RepID=UPI0030A0F31A